MNSYAFNLFFLSSFTQQITCYMLIESVSNKVLAFDLIGSKEQNMVSQKNKKKKTSTIVSLVRTTKTNSRISWFISVDIFIILLLVGFEYKYCHPFGSSLHLGMFVWHKLCNRK